MDIVSTLDPNKFAVKNQRRFNIGGLQSFGFHIALDNLPNPVFAPRLYYDMASRPHTWMYASSPPDTKAFLYYFKPPENPRIGGEIRFRVTLSDDPASFESGSDLLLLNGQPWSRPLCVISKYSFPLYKKLREDQFVPDDLVAVLSTFPRFPKYNRSQLLYTLNNTFIVDFSRPMRYLFVITEQGVETLPFTGFLESRKKFRTSPYKGAYTNLHLLILLD
jgi:hypothetical protein